MGVEPGDETRKLGLRHLDVLILTLINGPFYIIRLVVVHGVAHRDPAEKIGDARAERTSVLPEEEMKVIGGEEEGVERDG